MLHGRPNTRCSATFRYVPLVGLARKSSEVLAEFQRAAGLRSYREPTTIRTQVLTCGAILGRAGRRVVVHLSASWGGLKTKNPLAGKYLGL